MLASSEKKGSKCQWVYLYFAQDSGAVHPAGYIHCVPPDVILWFLGSDDSGYHWTVVNTLQRTQSHE